jgi:hypothetical protein
MMMKLLVPSTVCLGTLAVGLFGPFLAAPPATAEDGILFVQVVDTSNDAIPHVEIGTVGPGSITSTDYLGRGRIHLIDATRPGDQIELALVGRSARDWGFVSPPNGRVTIPSFASGNAVKIVLGRRATMWGAFLERDLAMSGQRSEVTFSDGIPPEILAADQLRVNGHEVGIAPGAPGRDSIQLLGGSAEVLLHKGTNLLEAQGTQLRFWWEGQKLQRLPAPYSRSYAILAAIDDYDRAKDARRRGPTGYRSLDSMIARSEQLRATLVKVGFPPANIVTLYDQNATSDRLSQELQRFWEGGDRATADRLFFYFGGHGAGTEGQGYLITYDFQAQRPSLTSFLMSDIVSRHFPNVRAHHMLVALDACSAGLAIPGLRNLGNSEEQRVRGFRSLALIVGDTKDAARNILAKPPASNRQERTPPPRRPARGVEMVPLDGDTITPCLPSRSCFGIT